GTGEEPSSSGGPGADISADGECVLCRATVRRGVFCSRWCALSHRRCEGSGLPKGPGRRRAGVLLFRVDTPAHSRRARPNGQEYRFRHHRCPCEGGPLRVRGEQSAGGVLSRQRAGRGAPVESHVAIKRGRQRGNPAPLAVSFFQTHAVSRKNRQDILPVWQDVLPCSLHCPCTTGKMSGSKLPSERFRPPGFPQKVPISLARDAPRLRSREWWPPCRQGWPAIG